MAHAFTPGLALTHSTLVRKLRELPLAGEVLVKVGDVVRADQEVARVALPGDLHILRLPEKMGLQPFEVLKGLVVTSGDSLLSGQLICEHAGLFGWLKSRYHSPVEGVVEFVSERTGHVGVRTASRPLSLDAYIAGTVVAVEPRKSVTIETRAALAQGIFGVGGEQRGVLELLPVSCTHRLRIEDLPALCEGKILVGGMSAGAAVLQHAARQGARGLIVGSIDDEALKEYVGKDIGIALTGDEDVPMTLIITEGFGAIPMSERIMSLMQQFQGKPCSVNGATQVRAGAVRPELIVPLDRVASVVPSEGNPASASPSGAGGLEVGSQIRLIRVPYFGQRAVVTELPHAAERIPTGAFTRVLRARLESGELVIVPRANVELLGV